MKSFSEISDEKILDGDKIKIDDLLNREIEVCAFRITDSRFPKNKSGKCLTLQIKENNTKRVVFTGSDVLIDQINKYGNHIPFTTTLRKINKYYTLT